MSPVTPTKQRLRELASLRPEGHKVLSLYLNLDPSEFPTPKARKTELESLLDVVERAVRDDGLPHDQKLELKQRRRADQDLVHERLRRQRHARRGRVRGLRDRPVRRPPAGPADPQRGDDRRLALHRAARGHAGRRRLRVLLINRQLARILAGGTDGMREVISFVDDVHRWHDQGGWSQARFQRGIQKETKDHVKHAGDELFKLFKRGVVQRLIIGCPDEMRGEVEHTLHSYLRERIAGNLDIDVKANPARGRARGGRDHPARRARPRAPLARPPAERARAQRARRRRAGGHARGAERAACRGAAGAGRLPAEGYVSPARTSCPRSPAFLPRARSCRSATT